MTDAQPQAHRIVLVGMMGSGKTTIGRRLATVTGWPYHDNDEALRAQSGSTPAELLATTGVDELHRLEGEVLAAMLALPAPSIVAAAAATILDASLRDQIRAAGFVVWLRASAAMIAARTTRGGRPFLGADDGWLERTIAEREPLYASVADLTIDTHGTGARAAARRILAELP